MHAVNQRKLIPLSCIEIQIALVQKWLASTTKKTQEKRKTTKKKKKKVKTTDITDMDLHDRFR